MNSGTFMVPVTVNEEQKTYLSAKYPGKELAEALKSFITDCLNQSTSQNFSSTSLEENTLR